MMRRVVLWVGLSGIQRRKKLYARACMVDCLRRHETPLCPQLLFLAKGVLNIESVHDRKTAFHAGLIWQSVADAAVFYADLGSDEECTLAQTVARSNGLPVESRVLPAELWPAQLGPR